MTSIAPPPGGRALYCPCGTSWASFQGSRRAIDHAACVLAHLGLDRVPCVACGGTIAALPASAEAHR